MWDTVRAKSMWLLHEVNHTPLAANILFMDGHVEFASYPQRDGSKYFMLSLAAQKTELTSFP